MLWDSYRRCGRDLNFETETWLRLWDRDRLHQTIRDPRLENLWIMPKFSKDFCKNFIATSKFKFFGISSIFPTCFGYFLPADIADKNTLNCRSSTKPYRCCIQSFKAIGLWPRPVSFRTRRNLKSSRPRLAKMGLETRPIHHQWQLCPTECFLLSQKLCHYLSLGLILNNILMRAAHWMAYFDLSKLNFSLS